MKRLITITCFCTVIGLAATLAAAEKKSYVKLDVGMSLVQDLEINEMAGFSLPATFTGDEDRVWRPSSTHDFLFPYTVNKPKITFDPGVRFGLAGGYCFNESLALEIESGLVYNSGEMETTFESATGSITEKSEGDLNLYQVPILANLIYTLPLKSKFKPYVGAGAGGIASIFDAPEGNKTDFTFAYQGMAGVVYQISDKVEVGIGYKFLGTLEQEFDYVINLFDLESTVKTEPVLTHSILASVTIKF